MLAEVDYFLRDERRAMQVFMQDLARGAFTHAQPTVGQISRAMEENPRFADLGLGLVDGSIVRSPSHLAFVVWQSVACVTSQPFGFVTDARSSSSSIRRIPTLTDSRRARTAILERP